MDLRVWTDHCPACGTACKPTESAVHDNQHLATYRCRCGRAWMTTRSVESYDGFDFQLNQQPERN